MTTARSEAKLLRQLAPVDAVEQLVLDVDKAAADSQQARAEHQEGRAGVRSLMDAGKLAGAESLLTGLPIGERERADMIGLIGRRRQEAAKALEQAANDADNGQVDAAIDGYLQALTMDRQLSEAAAAATLRHLAAAAVVPVRIIKEEEKKDLEDWLDDFLDD